MHHFKAKILKKIPTLARGLSLSAPILNP